MRIKWRNAAFQEILRAPGVKADLARRALAIEAAANTAAGLDADDDGYRAFHGEGRTRSRAAVIAGTVQSKRDNATHNRLIRSIDAGRG